MKKSLLYFFSVLALLSCRTEKPLFQQIKSSRSGIHFNNLITENDTLNALDLVNLYNGSGVGVGDFNNDGLPDVYLAGSIVAGKLYLNRGKFKFKDVTVEAKAEGEGRWCSGVSVVDINNDGWLDIYICATMKKNASDRKNILYINQGLSKNNIPLFKNMAAEYGLDDNSHSVQGVFFDYDNDGDLDAYIGVNEITESVYRYMNHPPARNGLNPSTGKLFRNDWNKALNHPVFTNVSRESGIQTEGYANAVYITDMNKDGWKDIFVSNDFLLPDLLWINNQDGTFTDQLGVYFKHITANAMGCDFADINNDGLLDMVELDMNPEDNFRKKTMLQSNKDLLFRNTEGYVYQFSRNTLQLNQGPRVGENDSIGAPVFSDVGYLAGIEATDWSWGPLIADFDNDRNNDILIHNGFPRDVTDLDFATFRKKYYMVIPKEQMLTQIPEVKLHNYAYRNLGDLQFSNVSEKWGLATPTFTNGTAYADLDLDGDLDLVMNNINDKASLYRNNQRQRNKQGNHYLQIRLIGDAGNRNGIGAWIEIYDQKGRQVWENNPFKGYLSTVDNIACFGLGSSTVVDSVIVLWPNGKKNVIRNVPADQRIIIEINKAESQYAMIQDTLAENALFRNVTRAMALNFSHKETEFNDFSKQPIMPHKFSDIGPALASGDIDGDGTDDFICGNSANQSAHLFLQKEGRFVQKPLLGNETIKTKQSKDAGILLFDADKDGDLDLYIASGGYEYKSSTAAYQDHFYINTGKGNFLEDTNAIPKNYASKLNVRSADYDQDGDLDLFVGARIEPWKYPRPVSGFIYRNDTRNGKIRFTDVTAIIAPELKDIGLINDAIFTDFNNDGWIDIVIAGEWMPLTFFQNHQGTSFRNVTNSTGIADRTGWWNSLSAGDFDNDGDIDYIAGNLGLNSYYRASDKHPVSVYATDFNNNRYYAFLSLFLPVNHMDTTSKEFPAQSRDDVVEQMMVLTKKFPDYKSFARATMKDIFTQEQLKGFLKRSASYFSSSYCRNEGNGKFVLEPLPVQAQISILNGMITDDFDGDGNLDVLITGNDYGTEVSVGRNDAMNGLFLQGDGQGGFTSKTILESGIFIPGNSKALIKLRGKNDNYLVVASQYRGPLAMFELKKNLKSIEWQPDDRYAEIRYDNGKLQKQECYHGSSYLSQSSAFLTVGEHAVEVSITNNYNQTRVVKF